MVAIKHPEIIDSRRWLIAAYFIIPEEEYEYGAVQDDVDALDEENERGSGQVGSSIGVTEEGTKQAEEVNQAM